MAQCFSTYWSLILGLILFAIALVLALRTKKIELGENLSRLIAVVVVSMLWFSGIGMPSIDLDSLRFASYITTYVALAGLIIVLGLRAWRARDAEWEKIKKSGRLPFAAVLLLVSQFLIDI